MGANVSYCCKQNFDLTRFETGKRSHPEALLHERMYFNAWYVKLAAHDAQRLTIFASVGEYDHRAVWVLGPVFIQQMK